MFEKSELRHLDAKLHLLIRQEGSILLRTRCNPVSAGIKCESISWFSDIGRSACSCSSDMSAKSACSDSFVVLIIYMVCRVLKVLTSTNWICQIRPYKSLYLHHGPYKSSSYWKRTSFFWVSDTGWFHTFTEFHNCLDIGWDDVWSRWCFPPCSFRSHATKIMVMRLCNNFCVRHFGFKIKLCKYLS